MKIRLKQLMTASVILALASIALSSCRTSHGSCPAYGGEAHRYKIERIYTR